MEWTKVNAWLKRNWPIYQDQQNGLTYVELAVKYKLKSRQHAHQICKGMEGYEKALGRRRLYDLANIKGEANG